jgi:hypothetical protein
MVCYDHRFWGHTVTAVVRGRILVDSGGKVEQGHCCSLVELGIQCAHATVRDSFNDAMCWERGDVACQKQ